MNYIFNKVFSVFLLLTVLGCKNDGKPISKNNHNILISEARNLIRQNCNILLDSVEQFDPPLPNGKKVMPKLTIGLIDSVSYHGPSNPYKYLAFKLKKTDLTAFKSSYKLNLVKEKNNDTNVVFVSFTNFSMRKGFIFIVVEKVRGIGMVREKYYFKKENGVWVYLRKRLINMG